MYFLEIVGYVAIVLAVGLICAIIWAARMQSKGKTLNTGLLPDQVQNIRIQSRERFQSISRGFGRKPPDAHDLLPSSSFPTSSPTDNESNDQETQL